MLQKNNRKKVTFESKKNTVLEKLLSWNSVILVLLSFAGTLIVFAYDLSRTNYFGLPIQIITIDTNRLIILSMFFILIGSVFFSFSIMIRGHIYKILRLMGIYETGYNYIASIIAFLSCSFLLLLALINSWNSILFYMNLLLLIFLVLFGIGFMITFISKRFSSIFYKAAANVLITIFPTIENDSKGDKRNMFLSLTLIPLYILASIELGEISAKAQLMFYVAKVTPECVVLYTNSERAICSFFDRTKKEIEPAYKILYYQDNQNIEFRKEEIGPLHLKPTPTPTLKPTLTPTITNTPWTTQAPTETQIPYP